DVPAHFGQRIFLPTSAGSFSLSSVRHAGQRHEIISDMATSILFVGPAAPAVGGASAAVRFVPIVPAAAVGGASVADALVRLAFPFVLLVLVALPTTVGGGPPARRPAAGRVWAAGEQGGPRPEQPPPSPAPAHG